jgi:hypothetical protein
MFEGNDTAEKRRARLIKEGITPPVSFEYKPINFSTSSTFKLLNELILVWLDNSRLR